MDEADFNIKDGLKVVVLADLHCGSKYGMVPPSYFLPPSTDPLIKSLDEARRWFMKKVKKHHKPDVLIHNGDAIEGKQNKMGCRELFTSDRHEQATMAADCLKVWGAKKIILTRGTGYHTGYGENWENAVGDILGAEVYNDYRGCFEGVTVQLRHKVGRSSTPYGQFTPLSKEMVWDELKSLQMNRDAANVIIRSHVHYSINVGMDGWEAITTPALQLPGGEYGEQQCNGYYDYGFLVFWFRDGQWHWERETMNLQPFMKPVEQITISQIREEGM